MIGLNAFGQDWESVTALANSKFCRDDLTPRALSMRILRGWNTTDACVVPPKTTTAQRFKDDLFLMYVAEVFPEHSNEELAYYLGVTRDCVMDRINS